MNLSALTAVDLILIVLLAGAFLLGLFQGSIRIFMALGAWVVSFVAAAHLRDPVGAWLNSQWRDVAPEYGEMIAFGFIFLLLFVASLLLIQGGYRRAPRLTNTPLVDELIGGVGGLVIGLLVIAATVVALDFFYADGRTLGQREVGWIADLNQALSTSALADGLRASVIPVLGTLLGPLLPSAVTAVMR